jgi:hypothetical protein
VEIYKLSLSMARTEFDFRKRIDMLLGEYGEALEIPNLVNKIQRFLRVAQLELKAVLLDAETARKKFLQTRQTEAAIASDPKEALKWKNIQRAEEIKAMYRKLRFIRRDSTQQSGLSFIEVPTNPSDDPKKCTDWTKIDNPQEITQYLLERNQKHFGQAQGTPFTTFPLNVEIDFSASTNISELILQGD